MAIGRGKAGAPMSRGKGVSSSGAGHTVHNRRAAFEYELGERYEAGLALIGSEARSLRENAPDLTDAWVDISAGEAWVKGLRIPRLDHAAFGHEDESRKRKLLLHRKEIEQLGEAVARERMTLVVTKLYFKNGRAKLEVAIGKGKRQYDKRQTLKQRDADREAQAAMRKHR
jgi:SsrA-binding protein